MKKKVIQYFSLRLKNILLLVLLLYVFNTKNSLQTIPSTDHTLFHPTPVKYEHNITKPFNIRVNVTSKLNLRFWVKIDTSSVNQKCSFLSLLHEDNPNFGFQLFVLPEHGNTNDLPPSLNLQESIFMKLENVYDLNKWTLLNLEFNFVSKPNRLDLAVGYFINEDLVGTYSGTINERMLDFPQFFELSIGSVLPSDLLCAWYKFFFF
jgi:hypothetical protein